MIRTLPLAALALAACAQTPPPAAAPPPPGDEAGVMCNVEALGNLVGRPADAALGAAALERSGARSLRWIQPGTAVTMDFRPDRLNVHLDEANVVTSVKCG